MQLQLRLLYHDKGNHISDSTLPLAALEREKKGEEIKVSKVEQAWLFLSELIG